MHRWSLPEMRRSQKKYNYFWWPTDPGALGTLKWEQVWRIAELQKHFGWVKLHLEYNKHPRRCRISSYIIKYGWTEWGHSRSFATSNSIWIKWFLISKTQITSILSRHLLAIVEPQFGAKLIFDYGASPLIWRYQKHNNDGWEEPIVYRHFTVHPGHAGQMGEREE